MRKILLMATLLFIAANCSGCATILGGIIGYQSGEAAAGAAIGAALDITGAISMSEHAKQEKIEQKEREEKLAEERKVAIKIYPDEGYIRVGSVISNSKNYGDFLKKRFDTFEWQYTENPVSSGDGISKRTFECKTNESKEFTLELLREKDQDLMIFIKLAEPNKEFQSMITSQIGVWVRDIAGQ